jgi:hypothetical protein
MVSTERSGDGEERSGAAMEEESSGAAMESNGEAMEAEAMKNKWRNGGGRISLSPS